MITLEATNNTFRCTAENAVNLKLVIGVYIPQLELQFFHVRSAVTFAQRPPCENVCSFFCHFHSSIIILCIRVHSPRLERPVNQVILLADMPEAAHFDHFAAAHVQADMTARFRPHSKARDFRYRRNDTFDLAVIEGLLCALVRLAIGRILAFAGFDVIILIPSIRFEKTDAIRADPLISDVLLVCLLP